MIVYAGTAFAQRGLGNVWHETGEYRGEDGIKIHADIDPATIKGGGYFFVVGFYDESGNPIKEYVPSRRGPVKSPVVIQAAVPSFLDISDLKDYTVFMPFRRLRDNREGRTAYFMVFLSQDPSGNNAVSQCSATRFYVPDY